MLIKLSFHKKKYIASFLPPPYFDLEVVESITIVLSITTSLIDFVNLHYHVILLMW
jgi:hypothetical protein